MQIERGMGKGRESELHTEKKSEREVCRQRKVWVRERVSCTQKKSEREVQIERGMGEGESGVRI